MHPYFLVLMQPVHQKHGPGSMIIAFVNTIKCSPYSFTASCSLVVSCFTSLELQYLSLHCVHKLFPITVPLQVQFIVLNSYTAIRLATPEKACVLSVKWCIHAKIEISVTKLHIKSLFIIIIPNINRNRKLKHCCLQW